jgi:hypothetical protein
MSSERLVRSLCLLGTLCLACAADPARRAVRLVGDADADGDRPSEVDGDESDAYEGGDFCGGATAANRPTLGVQRWDMYSGKGSTQIQELGYLPGDPGFLEPDEWHHRAPFFCRRTVDVHWVVHPAEAGPLWFNYPFDEATLQSAMDREIEYAAKAGIDYFIFNAPPRTLFANGWELHNNLDAYLSSSGPYKCRVHFVVSLFGHPSINYKMDQDRDWYPVERMLDEVIGYMQLPGWQRVKDDRPLVVVIWPRNFDLPLPDRPLADFVAHVRARVLAVGLNDPYIVAEEISHCYESAPILKAAGFDAMADYAGSYGGEVKPIGEGPAYAQATTTLVDFYNEQFLPTQMPFIPPVSNQHYPWPRATADTWYHYQLPRFGDVAARLVTVLDYVKAHPTMCDAQTAFMYSWNEHSEGGGLCPTMGLSPDYLPVTGQLDEVGAALRGYSY